MKIQPPPGMRDFYPEDMRLQNWLFDAWRSASLAFGFHEYEGPIFEYLELYTLKSGDEIAGQVFHVSRPEADEARFAIRPEMTPTLARMVAARANSLPRPIKWFSLPRMCRAERQQRGRLREFFQWNADILGVEGALADAEVIAVGTDAMRRLGLTADDVVVRISDRRILTALLASAGIAPQQATTAFQLIDRRDKLPPQEFARRWEQEVGGGSVEAVDELLRTRTLESALRTASDSGEAGRTAAQKFEDLWRYLDALGALPYCVFDLTVVRGLAYYTGAVFEAYPRKIALRALFGGGRYDDLTSLLDGPALPGVGLGMGDASVMELLRELGRLPVGSERLDAFVIDAEERYFPRVLELATMLRRAGLSADYSYKRQAVGKQLKQAAGRSARCALIVGQELEQRGGVAVKDLASGAQRETALADLLADPVFARPHLK